MTSYKGFETEQEAKAYAKKNGGTVVGSQSKQKYARADYGYCVEAGLDSVSFPWAVVKNFKQNEEWKIPQ